MDERAREDERAPRVLDPYRRQKCKDHIVQNTYEYGFQSHGDFISPNLIHLLLLPSPDIFIHTHARKKKMSTTVSHVDAIAAMSPRRRVKEAQERLERVSKLIDDDTFSFLCAYNQCQYKEADVIDRSRKRARGGVEEYTLRDLISDDERITPATVWSQLRRRTEVEIQIVHREIAKVVRQMANIYPLCERTTVDDLVRSEAIVKRCIEMNVRPDEVHNIEELRARGCVSPRESDETFFERYLHGDIDKNVHTYRTLQNHYSLLMYSRLKLIERRGLF